MGPGRESAPTWAGEPLKTNRPEQPEPKGKLDTMTGYSWSTPVVMAMPALGVNGPEDDVAGLGLRRLAGPRGQRTATAAADLHGDAGRDWPKVRSLQKLMLRSRSNTLVSVRQVTQRNAGRKTAGIDGEVALTSEARAEVAVRVHATHPDLDALRGQARVHTEGQ